MNNNLSKGQNGAKNSRTENCSKVTVGDLSLSVLGRRIANQQDEFICLTNMSSIELPTKMCQPHAPNNRHILKRTFETK